MAKKYFKNFLFMSLAGLMVLSPVFKGSVHPISVLRIELFVWGLTFLWACRLLKKNKIKLKKTKVEIVLALLILIASISTSLSTFPYASLLALSTLLTYIAFFYLIVNNFGTQRQLTFCYLIVAIATALSLFGLGQCFLGLNHSWWKPMDFLASTYVNHNHFAGYLEMAIPLCCGLLLGLNRRVIPKKFKLKALRLLLFIVLFILLFTFIMTQSRGGWVSLTIAFIIYNYILIKKRRFARWTLAVFFVILMFGVLFLYMGEDSLANRLKTIENNGAEASWQTRMMIWQGCVDMIKTHKIVGTGPGTFVWNFCRYRPKGLDSRVHYAHNDYLHAACELGIFILPVIAFFIYIIISTGLSLKREGSKLSRNIRLASTIGLISLIIHGFVDFNFHIPANMLLAICLAAMVLRPLPPEA